MTDTVGFLHSGGGLVDALLSAGTKKIRGITRSSSSKKAKDLAAKGVEVVEADLGNKASLSKVPALLNSDALECFLLQALFLIQIACVTLVSSVVYECRPRYRPYGAFSTQAFTGADELFLVTDFFAAGASYDGEFQQGKNAVDAAKEVIMHSRSLSGIVKFSEAPVVVIDAVFLDSYRHQAQYNWYYALSDRRCRDMSCMGLHLMFPSANLHLQIIHLFSMRQAGIKFVVFSALEGMPTDVKEKLPSLGGGLTVAHFESKNAVSVSPAKFPMYSTICI